MATENEELKLTVPLDDQASARAWPSGSRSQAAIEPNQERYIMSDDSKQSWTRPAAMAMPKGGFFADKVEQGRYGPIFPKTPACYGFSILAKVIPGRESASTSMLGI
jgi:hypothetical protein